MGNVIASEAKQSIDHKKIESGFTSYFRLAC
jgi:hypothetical protein